MRLRYGFLALLGLIVAARPPFTRAMLMMTKIPLREDPFRNTPTGDDEVPDAVEATTSKKKEKPEAAAAVPGAATDETPDRVNFTGELLAGTPLDSGNRALYGVGGGGGLGVEIFISPLLASTSTATFCCFPKAKPRVQPALRPAGSIPPAFWHCTVRCGHAQ